MRASTVFALTLALLIGLGALVGARYMGYLGKQEPPRKEIQVLVAARNLFANDVIETTWVKARALRAEEIAHYEANKQQYLPPVPGAASLRIPKRSIEADTPILREDLKEMAKPEPLAMRLLPNMRAVNLTLPKDQSAGGLIQVGEWVDVYMTTTINSDGQETTRTAPIANRLRVIAKRNALWNVFGALPDNKPVHFTLEANPYRAGLIEFARTKGVLCLIPVSAAEQKDLEGKRVQLLDANVPEEVLPVSFNKKAGSDYAQEEVRVEALNRGEYAIGSTDLMRIFDLNTGAPPRPQYVVESFNGLKRGKTMQFDSEGQFVSAEDPKARRNNAAARSSDVAKAGPSVQFSSPDCKDGSSRKSSGTGRKRGA
ncbi:MAG: Flp pilus assembly protein CpaB [Gemmataceae bacterium]